jgi:hypothetical protein
MPITPFLNGEHFDLEGERVLRVAFEMVCIALRTGDCDDGVKQAIATKLIALAKAGERNPDFVRRSIEGHSQAQRVGRLRSGAVFRLTIGTEDSELGQHAISTYWRMALWSAESSRPMLRQSGPRGCGR